MSANKVTRLESYLLLILFCSAIALPLCKQWVFGEPDTLTIEARPLNKFPVLSHKTLKGFRQYTDDFESYYNDHFGFRSLLLKLDTFVKIHLLHISLASSVQMGRDHWLYYKDWVTFRGGVELTNEDMEHWRRTFEARRDWLAKKGIRYVVLIGPNKDTIYPEYQPLPLNPSHVKSQVQQLEDYLAAHSDFRIISPRERLLREKKSGPLLYYPNDSHWDLRGAYLGYFELATALRKWFPEIKPMAPETLVKQNAVHHGDLSRMIGDPDYGLWEEPQVKPSGVSPSTKTNFKLPGVDQPSNMAPFTLENRSPGTRLRVVMFHDSFGIEVIRFLMPHLARLTSIWPTEMNPKFEHALAEVVDREKPDIFIEEHVERALAAPPPQEAFVFGEGH